jgi:hypothetical protein
VDTILIAWRVKFTRPLGKPETAPGKGRHFTATHPVPIKRRHSSQQLVPSGWRPRLQSRRLVDFSGPSLAPRKSPAGPIYRAVIACRRFEAGAPKHAVVSHLIPLDRVAPCVEGPSGRAENTSEAPRG